MRQQNLFYEDRLVGASLRQKFSMLYSHPVTCRIFYNGSVDYYENLDINENDIHIQCIQALVKMILMTPDDKYDPSHAFSILNFYPDATVKNAIEKLKDTGAIVKVKGGSDRRVPGRGYQFSDRFISVISGSLPDRMFSQAITCHKKLTMATVFDQFSDSGDMACLLDKLSAGK
ncbi:4272_t:CDS:2, partial [Dentiscutata heterogama]